MEYTVEALAASDVTAVLALLQRSGLPNAGFADHVETALVVRSRDGDIAGSGALELHDGLALLRSVAVDEDHQGRGLGQRITGALLDLARSRAVRGVYLLTETAEPFFARLGFERCSRDTVPAPIRGTVEFSSACPASAAVMRLVLSDH